MLRVYLKLFLLVFVFASVSCTRKADNKSSKLTFKIPNQMTSQSKVGALAIPANFYISHVVVNVSGSGMPKVIWNWDAHNCASIDSCYSPNVIVLDVPAGPARLIQYLGVFEDPLTGAMLFTYGDKTMDLAEGDNVANILPEQFGGTTSNREVLRMGQYVTSVVGGKGHGPTALIDIGFAPPNGAPPLSIETSEMIDGWFNVFGIEGVPFTYRLLPTGELLTALHESVLESRIASSEVSLLKVSSPDVYYRDYCYGYCTPGEWYLEDPVTIYFGYYGPALASLTGAQACYPSAMSSIQYLSTASDGSTMVGWSTSASTNDFSRIGGGQASCSGTEYHETITLNPSRFQYGNWSASPIQGAFAPTYISMPDTLCNQDDIMAVCYMGSTLTIKWNYIPGIFEGPDPITGVSVFTKVVPECTTPPCDDPYEMYQSDSKEGFMCSALESMGFAKQADYVGASQTTHSDSSFSLGGGRQLLTILCPYKNLSIGGRFYFNGIASHQHTTGQMGTVNILGLTGGTDNNQDSYLGTTGIPTVFWSYDSNYVGYQVEIWDSMETNLLCGPMFTYDSMTTSVSFDASCTLSDNDYIVKILAYDSEAYPVAYGMQYFTVDTVAPSITSVTGSCSSWNGGTFVQLDIAVVSSESLSWDWITSWSWSDDPYSAGSGTNSAANALTYTSTGTINAQIDMNSGSTVKTVETLLVKARDLAGNEATYPISTFNITTGPTCSF